jgi:hypothetical protein
MRCAVGTVSTWLALLAIACGGNGSNGQTGADAGDDSGAPGDDGSIADAGDASDAESGDSGGGDDGTPSYTPACTPLSQQTGTAINTFHGRLDGYLSFVVPVGGSHSCNGDSSHLHMQVRMKGSIYDVAVDMGKFSGDVLLYEMDEAIPDGAWSEGWHGNDSLDYHALGLVAAQFTPEDPATLGQKLQTELAGVNHVSVFGENYTQGNGCHQVHYVGGGNDGAIVVHPLAAKAHVLFFRFSTQSF